MHRRFHLAAPYFFVSILFVLMPPACRTHSYPEVYDIPYTLKVDEEVDNDGNEDGFIHAMPFGGQDASNNKGDSIYLGVDKNSQCKCREYIYHQYVTCYDPDLCVTFPRDMVFHYNTLRLSTTKIRELRKNDLGLNNPHLEVFKMDGNEEFSEIEPGAFMNMSRLMNISIVQNPKLTHLNVDAFLGCDNLEVLSVIENGFIRFLDITIALSPRALPNLRKLRLARIQIPIVTKEDFEVMTGTSLMILNIVTCAIKYIDPRILVPLFNLKVLRIGENSLNDNNLLELISRIDAMNMTLENFSLSNSGFRKFPKQILEEIGKTNINHLSLCCGNTFEIIERFPVMINLKYLNLKNVNAINIIPDAFKNLYHLETLILNQNKLSKIQDGFLLPYLKNLDISDNTENDQYYFSLTSTNFMNMKRLERLNISHNNIRYISNHSFAGLEALKVLDLEDSKVFAVDNNSFGDLKELLYLDVRKNAYPGRTMYPDIYNGLTKLRVLIMSGCDIQTITPDQNIFLKMPSLQYIILNDNKIEKLGKYLFESLPELEYIDVAQNFLKVWDFRLFPQNHNLKTIICQDNIFRTITKPMMDDFTNLERLDIRNNGFFCTCSTFKKVLDIIPDEVVELLDKQPPLCKFPDDYWNTSITDYMREINTTDNCDNERDQGSSGNPYVFTISLTVMLIFITAGIIVIYIYRWHIRYWLFLAKMAVSGSRDSLKERFQPKRSYRYDAFISYCNEDRNFVIRLVEMLENYEPFLKLCVYERDFQIGTVISESVLESVADSRRTLLVISDAYIRSQWCRWEVQVADNHRLFSEDENGRRVNDSLIMVKLGDISASTISPMLRYLMNTRIYLEWDEDTHKQKSFWKKLRRVLNPPGKLAKISVL